VAAFDPEDAESAARLPDRHVGELRVRGASTMAGYFDDAELTRGAFAGGWLRTGDLGYLVAGDVFVCGRTKELVIVRGRNYFPQDLERCAAAVEGVRPGNVVAFGSSRADGDVERVVMAFETKVADPERRKLLAAEVRRAVHESTGVALDEIVVLDAGVLPKTSSGKLQRGHTRELFEQGLLASRRTVRLPDPLGTARVLAQSQLAYARRALFGMRK
jgi:acyl-CoA synthetase (AMP-forming)/AMP-acid ligase II